ncbi:hypothetical protein [Nitrospira sp. Nam74]
MNVIAIAFPIISFAVSIGASGISWADRVDGSALTKQRDEPGSTSTDKHPTGQEQRLPVPKDCKEIEAGTGFGGDTTQQAAQRDCERSRALGSGTGVSSGTGSGKMRSGQGAR